MKSNLFIDSIICKLIDIYLEHNTLTGTKISTVSSVDGTKMNTENFSKFCCIFVKLGGKFLTLALMK